jgi:small subunit ribosomal protein S2
LAAKYSKLEVQRFQEEITELNRIYGGIQHMAARPGAVFVLDVVSDINAIREARKLGLKIVALVDTNADPTLVDYPIPSNDDAIKTIQLIIGYIKQAIETGRAKNKPAVDKTEA